MRAHIAIFLSMTAVFPLVNASAEDLPISNPPSHKSALKDSVKQPSNELSRLVEILMKTGEDDSLGSTSRQLGLEGDLPTKGRDFTVPGPSGKERREFSIVFSGDSGNTPSSTEKRPTCLYIAHRVDSGRDAEAIYYRLSLNGKLEHVIDCHFKYDEDGKPVPGSAVDVEKDIDSPAVQKAFKSEFAYWTKDWIKAEKKAQARAVAAPSASQAK